MKRRLLLLLATVKRSFPRVLLEESGQDLVEYSLLLVLVAVGTIAAVDRLGDDLYYTFHRIAHAVNWHGWDYK